MLQPQPAGEPVDSKEPNLSKDSAGARTFFTSDTHTHSYQVRKFIRSKNLLAQKLKHRLSMCSGAVCSLSICVHILSCREAAPVKSLCWRRQRSILPRDTQTQKHTFILRAPCGCGLHTDIPNFLAPAPIESEG